VSRAHDRGGWLLYPPHRLLLSLMWIKTRIERNSPVSNPMIEKISRFFESYAAKDVEAMRTVLADDIEWTIPGHHPLSGTKRGIEEVTAFFNALTASGFQATPLFLEANDEYVVDIHRGWTTEGVGQVDTLWALVWHFTPEGKFDRVYNLTMDQHQMDAYVWANIELAPLPDRLA
jgi:ketosteroid isomerase-like protein